MAVFSIGGNQYTARQQALPTKGSIIPYSVRYRMPMGFPYIFRYNPAQIIEEFKSAYNMQTYMGGNLPSIESNGRSEQRLSFTLELCGDDQRINSVTQFQFNKNSPSTMLRNILTNAEIPLNPLTTIPTLQQPADIFVDTNPRDVGLIIDKLSSIQLQDKLDDYRLLFTFGTHYRVKSSVYIWLLEEMRATIDECDADGTPVHATIEMSLLADATSHAERDRFIEGTTTLAK